MSTRHIPHKVTNIPKPLRSEILSLKNRNPAPTEKIGTDAMIIALMVGEPVSLMP
jgi:hypothetical protein